MTNYSDPDVRAVIFAKMHENILNRHVVTDTRQVSSEPELTDEEIRQLAFERSAETRNMRDARLITERDAQLAAERALRETTKAETMANLEARLDARYRRLINDQREFVFEAVGEAFKIFYEEQIIPLICEPYEKKFAELQASVDSLRAQVAELKARNFDPIDLPNPLAARRVQ